MHSNVKAITWKNGVCADGAVRNAPINAKERWHYCLFIEVEGLTGSDGTAQGHVSYLFFSLKLFIVLVPMMDPCRRQVLNSQSPVIRHYH